jgi:hypothetical protein
MSLSISRSFLTKSFRNSKDNSAGCANEPRRTKQVLHAALTLSKALRVPLSRLGVRLFRRTCAQENFTARAQPENLAV